MSTQKVNGIVKEVFIWILTILAALVIASIINNTLFSFVKVIGPSMEPTMYTNHKLFLSKISQTISPVPERGDIVVIQVEKGSVPWIPFLNTNERNYIKRVIGLPGEKVEIKNGYVFIDGEKLDEPYIGEQKTFYSKNGQNSNFSDIVPDNHIFVLGDHRAVSKDSRSDELGYVNIEVLQGKVLFRVLPLSQFGGLD